MDKQYDEQLAAFWDRWQEQSAKKKKVSEWLGELYSHSILDCEAARKDFETATGKRAPWGKGVTRTQMERAIKERGKGGTLAETKVKLISAIDIARRGNDRT